MTIQITTISARAHNEAASHDHQSLRIVSCRALARSKLILAIPPGVISGERVPGAGSPLLDPGFTAENEIPARMFRTGLERALARSIETRIDLLEPCSERHLASDDIVVAVREAAFEASCVVVGWVSARTEH